MSTAFKFIILYIIPIVKFASAVGVYIHSYGKSPAKSYVNFAFVFIIVGFIVSCTITIALLSQYMSGESVYSGIVFSVLPWLVELIVVSLYVYVFYFFYDYR